MEFAVAQYIGGYILLLALGIFVIVYALYSLSGLRSQREFSSSYVIPFGVAGGLFSALFGSGGFIYAIYLSGRIEHKESLLITQTTLIGFSTLTRVIMFVIAGVYMDISIILSVLILIPAMLIGTYIGRHVTLKLTKKQFIQIINIMILISGITLLTRYFL